MQDKFTAALLSAATSYVASEEKITDEDAALTRANDIFQDAQKEVPETLEGQKVRSIAQDIVAVQDTGAVESPYIPKVSFDFEKLRNETSIPACEQILKKMGEYSAFLIIPTKASEAYQKEAEKAYEKLSMASFQALNDNNVGMSEYKFIFDSLKAAVSALEEIVMQQVIGHRHEVMSRQFGAKNPATGKFDANHATYQNLKDTLERIRKETGDNLGDYFNVNPEK